MRPTIRRMDRTRSQHGRVHALPLHSDGRGTRNWVVGSAVRFALRLAASSVSASHLIEQQPSSEVLRLSISVTDGDSRGASSDDACEVADAGLEGEAVAEGSSRGRSGSQVLVRRRRVGAGHQAGSTAGQTAGHRVEGRGGRNSDSGGWAVRQQSEGPKTRCAANQTETSDECSGIIRRGMDVKLGVERDKYI